MNTEDIPDSPSPVEELPRITATYNELQDAKVIEASTEQSSPQYRVTLADLPKPPLLNRAQRRSLRKYIRHKAALQMRHVFSENARKQWMHMTRQENRCRHCRLWPIPAPTGYRCQCQVEQRRQCRMCGVDCMASSQAWRQTNVCYACSAQIEL